MVEDSIYNRFSEYAEEGGVIKSEENFTEYCMNNQDEIIETLEHLYQFA
jgi:hypothetical protein